MPTYNLYLGIGLASTPRAHMVHRVRWYGPAGVPAPEVWTYYRLANPTSMDAGHLRLLGMTCSADHFPTTHLSDNYDELRFTS